MLIDNLNVIESGWRTFLIDVELAKKHPMISMWNGRHLPAPNPILEKLLPSLLYLRLAVFLDETFKDYLETNNLLLINPYRNDFNGRITFLNDQGCLSDSDKVHELRRKRNVLAHAASQSSTWADLEEAITIVGHELQHLRLVASRPTFEFYAERKPREKAEPGSKTTFDCRYGLKEAGKEVYEVSWIISVGL